MTNIKDTPIVSGLKKAPCIVMLLIITIAGVSCKNKDESTTSYTDAKGYFLAVKKLEEGNKKEALSLLKEAENSSSPLISRCTKELMTEELTPFLQLQSYRELYSQYGDDDSLLRLCIALDKIGDYKSIIEYTGITDYTSTNNDIIMYRIKALYQTDREKALEEYYRWFTCSPISSSHYKAYTYIKDNCDEERFKSNPLIDFRILVYLKNYSLSYSMIKNSLLMQDKDVILPQIVRDIGKTYLYAAKNYTEAASDLSSLLQKNLTEESQFYVYFYQGRLYDKTSKNKEEAISCFKKAMDRTLSTSLYDNALWYYLNSCLKISEKTLIESLSIYAPLWHDGSYYDDLFDNLCVSLITDLKYQDFYDTYKIIKSYASKETCAKYAYISARLIEEDLVKVNEVHEELIKSLYVTALHSGTDPYYRILACYRLGMDIKTAYSDRENFNCNDSFVHNMDAELLVNGYVDFDITDKVYDTCMFYIDSLSMDTVAKASKYLRDKANDNTNHDYYSKSLRLVSKKANHIEKSFTDDFLSLLYPQDYSAMVEEITQEYDVNNYLIYALMRTESFFDHDVKSHAGAVGLTQLMEPTARDVARKLKISNYDLLDPYTNILFGTFYIDELIKRLDNSQILAIFSYNGGISRVRSWYKSSQKELGIGEVPKDLFLETVPYAETRDYGRKVLSAAVMYGVLYCNSDSSTIIREIME